MAADTTTPLLGLLLQGTGNNNNAWGQNLNDQVITPIENAIAGIGNIAVTGAANVTLTADQSRNSMILFNGTLTADQTIIVPSKAKRWTFINNCVGNFFMLMKTAAGTPINIPAGKFTKVICDGTQVYREDATSVGEFFYHAGSVAPSGSMECRGGTALRASAVDLYNIIGTMYGAGDGFSTFGLPNGYDTGRYLRSRTSTVASGTYQASQNKAHTHAASGNTNGASVQHSHLISGNTGSVSNDHTHVAAGATAGQNASHYHAGTGTTAGMNSNATHNHTYQQHNAINQTTPGGNFPVGGTYDGIYPTSTANIDHSHGFNFTTGYQVGDHAHSFVVTTTGVNAYHTHPVSFTSGGNSVDHTHSFSLVTDSNGGTDARPESIVGILCIRY